MPCLRHGAIVASLNVLVTAASRRVPLIRAFQDALKSSAMSGRVILTDVNRFRPGVPPPERCYPLPLATAPDYLDAISSICEREHVGLIVPTIDDELEIFGAVAADFESRGIKIAVSPEPTAHICHEK